MDSKMNSFREKVYKLAAEIPKGRVATYGQLAKLAGNPMASRAVGSLMRRNPDPLFVPCHRVVGGQGQLLGYAFGRGLPDKKKKLLVEQVIFIGTRVDLKKCGWTPKV